MSLTTEQEQVRLKMVLETVKQSIKTALQGTTFFNPLAQVRVEELQILMNAAAHVHDDIVGALKAQPSTGVVDLDSIAVVVHEAIGGGSVCWSNMRGTGVFQSKQAQQIGHDAVERIKAIINDANVRTKSVDWSPLIKPASTPLWNIETDAPEGVTAEATFTPDGETTKLLLDFTKGVPYPPTMEDAEAFVDHTEAAEAFRAGNQPMAAERIYTENEKIIAEQARKVLDGTGQWTVELRRRFAQALAAAKASGFIRNDGDAKSYLAALLVSSREEGEVERLEESIFDRVGRAITGRIPVMAPLVAEAMLGALERAGASWTRSAVLVALTVAQKLFCATVPPLSMGVINWRCRAGGTSSQPARKDGPHGHHHQHRGLRQQRQGREHLHHHRDHHLRQRRRGRGQESRHLPPLRVQEPHPPEPLGTPARRPQAAREPRRLLGLPRPAEQPRAGRDGRGHQVNAARRHVEHPPRPQHPPLPWSHKQYTPRHLAAPEPRKAHRLGPYGTLGLIVLLIALIPGAIALALFIFTTR